MKIELKENPDILDEKEAILNTIIDNYDGCVWSIDRSYHSLYLNSRLKEIMQELYGIDGKHDEKIFTFLESFDPGLARNYINRLLRSSLSR